MSVKKVNMSFNNILLFTDLDGTLLNKKTFEFKAALDLIKNCISKGINIIPNSSKTDLEPVSYTHLTLPTSVTV